MKPAKLFAAIAAIAFIGVPAALAQSATPAATPTTTPAAKDGHAHDTKQPSTHDGKVKVERGAGLEVAKVGSLAPDFTLTDTEGKEVKLSSFAGKPVVLEWFNPDCPFVKKYHEGNKTMAELNEKYSAKGVVFLAINSGAAGKQGSGKEHNAKARTAWKLAYPVLLDETGKVGRQYGSKHTPTMYVIDKNGVLAYSGAIDDSKDDVTKVGKTNYIANALDELLANKPVTTTQTEAFGCAVKYGTKK